MLRAVCNSGPLIHLAQINKFKLLNLFDEIFIPLSVFKEVCVGKEPKESEIKLQKNIKIVTIKKEDKKRIDELKMKLKKWKLDYPELEAIYLTKKLNVGILLTDDLDAREAAKSIGIEVHGSVGIITRAFKEKLLNLENTEKALIDLYEKSKLFISRKIIETAINEIKNVQKS